MVRDIVAANGRTSQDADLDEAILDALLRNAGVRVWTDALHIQSHNGVVELGGHVRTIAEHEFTLSVVRSVPGVRDIVNRLYVDTDLEVAVAQALGQDPRTRGSFPGILVGSAFGEIFLKGSVTSQEIKKAASEIAARVPGVRAVNNQLEAPEPPKPTAPAAKPAPKPAAKPAPKPTEEEGESAAEE